MLFWNTAGRNKHFSNLRQYTTSEMYLFTEKESSLFKHNVGVFRKSLKIILYLLPCAIEAKLIFVLCILYH